ncbi:hypothetical protein L3Q82_000947 [Scortum barcoo]|uniref:Uncharacterized protein n=1 Tax=Scortum barcoo TaxID=214431 RepID=A0ACB8WE21_9TELE|nr:hypothetical protein L3Q82_000947 [Scortum barcoo]
MSQKLQMLRYLVKERLEAAADEIFGLFEKTVTAYEEKISLLQDIERQHRLLSAAFSPEVKLHRSVFPGDVQQLLVIKEKVSPGWSPSLNQDFKLQNIRGEQKELWTSQEVEQQNGLEMAETTKDPFTALPVKSEDEEERLYFSHAQQSQTEDNREAEPMANSSSETIKTEADGEGCGGSEPAGNQDPVR